LQAVKETRRKDVASAGIFHHRHVRRGKAPKLALAVNPRAVSVFGHDEQGADRCQFVHLFFIPTQVFNGEDNGIRFRQQRAFLRPVHIAHEPFAVGLAVPALRRQADKRVREKAYDLRVNFRCHRTEMHQLASPPGSGNMFRENAGSRSVEVLHAGTS